MVSAMGDAEGRGKGGFVLLDEDFKVLFFLLRHGQPLQHASDRSLAWPFRSDSRSEEVGMHACAGQGDLVRCHHRVRLRFLVGTLPLLLPFF